MTLQFNRAARPHLGGLSKILTFLRRGRAEQEAQSRSQHAYSMASGRGKLPRDETRQSMNSSGDQLNHLAYLFSWARPLVHFLAGNGGKGDLYFLLGGAVQISLILLGAYPPHLSSKHSLQEKPGDFTHNTEL